MDGEFQNNISELSKLDDYKYENLFRVYNIDNYYVYNIINSIKFDKNIDNDYYYEWVVRSPLPWTTISFIHYDSIHLWWLICILNEIQNPIQFPESGTRLKIFKPSYVRRIIDKIQADIDK
jgi:hypothetical protein